jgi:hypothetical protein
MVDTLNGGAATGLERYVVDAVVPERHSPREIARLHTRLHKWLGCRASVEA